MGLEAVHSHLRGLRTSADVEEQRLLACLIAVEQTEYWLTEANSLPTFASWLAHHKYMSPERYADLLEGVNIHTWSIVSVIGLHATRQLAGVHNDAQAETVKTRMVDVAQRTGMPLSARHARSIVTGVTGAKTRAEHERTRIAELEAECQRLRSELRKVERENKKLASELKRRGGDPAAIRKTVLVSKPGAPGGTQPTM